MDSTLKSMNEFQDNKENESYSYASIGDRCVSYLKDYLLVFLVSILIFLLFEIIDKLFGKSLNYHFNLFGFNFVFIFFCFFGYPIICITGLLSDMHATRSQYKMGMSVVNENGIFLTTTQAIIRTLLCVFSGLSLVNIVLIACTKKHQSLQDLLLKQVVVKRK